MLNANAHVVGNASTGLLFLYKFYASGTLLARGKVSWRGVVASRGKKELSDFVSRRVCGASNYIP